MFALPFERLVSGPDTEQYLLLSHNCTDSGEVIEERFDLSSFAEHQEKPYSTMSQGFGFLPFSSHDTGLSRKIAEFRAFNSYFSRWEQKSVPKAVFVEGEALQLGLRHHARAGGGRPARR